MKQIFMLLAILTISCSFTLDQIKKNIDQELKENIIIVTELNDGNYLSYIVGRCEALYDVKMMLEQLED